MLYVLNSRKYKGIVKLIGIPDAFIQHGAPDILKANLKLDTEGVKSKVRKVHKKLEKK